ncbi:hypothetical protein ACIOUE_37765 [Streptomyces xanthochromogenes]|uniref:hypothetical protein n=1 Tax=Streptomyces xanthochromogenes TaxID=67384 RepID=UPI0037F1FAB0
MTAPITLSSRFARTTVGDLLTYLDTHDVPDWAELRIEVPTRDGSVDSAVFRLDYARGFLTALPDPTDRELPTPRRAYDVQITGTLTRISSTNGREGQE